MVLLAKSAAMLTPFLEYFMGVEEMRKGGQEVMGGGEGRGGGDPIVCGCARSEVGAHHPTRSLPLQSA